MEEKEIQDHHSIQELAEVVLQQLEQIHHLMEQVELVEQEEQFQLQIHVLLMVVVVEQELVLVEVVMLELAVQEVEEQDNLIQGAQ
tara:strand:+ start:213 stop:470 length:258 start_codon:yes stop_codon:yes gene_type:complete